jgi:hypothetical protein
MLAGRQELGLLLLCSSSGFTLLVDTMLKSLHLGDHLSNGKSSRILAIGTLERDERGYQYRAIWNQFPPSADADVGKD